METKTTATIGILFLVIVIGGALVLSSYGVSTVGQYYKKATLDSGTCDTAYLFQGGICLPKESGEPTYLDSDGCCRSCSDQATGPEACGDCLGLNDNCRWQTNDLIIACFDTTDPLYFQNCDDYCRFNDLGQCYSNSCNFAETTCN
jgi:hypothetical protein|tara:strand:- start:372 stop:809 length:438 start_codon:yes stop_codon:yes gene_type:complete